MWYLSLVCKCLHVLIVTFLSLDLICLVFFRVNHFTLKNSSQLVISIVQRLGLNWIRLRSWMLLSVSKLDNVFYYFFFHPLHFHVLISINFASLISSFPWFTFIIIYLELIKVGKNRDLFKTSAQITQPLRHYFQDMSLAFFYFF
jgi:hypothetical protein